MSTPTLDPFVTLLIQKIDRLDERLDDQAKTLVRQNHTLEEHIRRSEANEASLEILRQEFQPIKNHVAVFGAVAKVFSILGPAAFGLFELLRFFGKI